MARTAQDERRESRALFARLREYCDLDRLFELFTPAVLRTPRRFFDSIELDDCGPGLKDIPGYRKIPDRFPDVTDAELQGIYQIITSAVRTHLDNAGPEGVGEEVPAHAAGAARAAVVQAFDSHQERKAIASAVGWTTLFLANIPPIASSVIVDVAGEMLDDFLVPCVPPELQHDIAAASEFIEKLSIVVRSARRPQDIVDIANAGDAERIHDVISWAGTNAFRWAWVKNIVDAWCYTVAHAKSTAERRGARQKLMKIGEALSRALAATGRMKLDEATLQRRRRRVSDLLPVVRVARRQFKAGRNDPAAVKSRGELSDEDFGVMLRLFGEMFETTDVAYALAARAEERLTGDSLTGEGLRHSLKAHRTSG